MSPQDPNLKSNQLQHTVGLKPDTQAAQLLCMYVSGFTSHVQLSLDPSHFPTFKIVLHFLMQPLNRWERDMN